MQNMKSLLSATILAVCIPLAALGQVRTGQVRLILDDNPAGPSVSIAPATEQQFLPLQEWLLRTGIKKGVGRVVLDEEAAAASDVAVLKSGFYLQALAFLAEMREPSFLAGPDALAGLTGTKSVLLVPTGGLGGAASSEFFKAGLGEFVRSGGTVICLAQRTGADYGSLPVPEGGRIEGAGWTQERGPLFGASLVKKPLPFLARMIRAVPRIETSGSLAALPAGAQVVLVRADGRPTLVVYPCGKGRVVVAALFTDVLSFSGHADAEERSMLQDLVFWAKSPSKVRAASPGDTLDLDLTIRGTEQDSAKVRVLLVGSGGRAPAYEQTVDLPVKTGVTASLPFRFTLPAALVPGIYHFEYLLLDGKNRQLSSGAECAEGMMSVGAPPVAGNESIPAAPFPAAPPALRVHAEAVPGKNSLRFMVESAAPDPSAPAPSDEMVLRAPGGEKTFRLEKGRASFTIDLGERGMESSVPLEVRHVSGLVLYRDVITTGPREQQGVTPDRALYLPGDTARIGTHGLPNGEMTLTGLGQVESDIVTADGSMAFPVPEGFPAGNYPLAWEIRSPDGRVIRGETNVGIGGYRVRIAALNVRPAPGSDGSSRADATLVIQAERPLNATIRVQFAAPDGSSALAAETAMALRAGTQEVTLPILLKSARAGIGSLAASVNAPLPEGPGIPAGNVPFAVCTTLVDRGTAAIIGLAADQVFFDEPSERMAATAYLFGSGKPTLRLSLDGKRKFKERIELSGIRTVTVALDGVKPGAQPLRAELEGAGLPDSCELTVVNGTGLPDLVPSVVVGDISGTSLDIGIGIRNEGRQASAPSRAALFDGDPDRDGRAILKVEVPALDPGQEHVSITKWSVLERTGMRVLYAIADAKNAVAESNKRNNREQFPYLIPDLMVKVATLKKEFGPLEPIPYSLDAVNLSGTDRKRLHFAVQVTGPDGKPLSSETIGIDELPSTKSRNFSRTFTPAGPLPPGKYLITAELDEGDTVLANTLAEISVPPLLALGGAFEGTPEKAVLCRPFTVGFRARNAGNVAVSDGTLTIEVRAPGAAAPALARRVPLTFEPNSVTFDRLDLPAGDYTIALKASASSKEHRLMREITVAEQPLVVAAPLTVEAAGAAFPRVLVWAGSIGGSLARAAVENMVRIAFQEKGIFSRIVNTPEEFTELAGNGMFNVFVLLDVSEPPGDPRRLKNLVEEGRGMVITGSDETAQSAAGAFGFSFGEPLSSSGASLVIADGSGLGFMGSIPVSGTVLRVKKKGSTPLALTADSGQAALFLDRAGSGKIVYMPFPLILSSRESGSGNIYALLLRGAAGAVTPERDDQGGFAAGGVTLSSVAGTVKARVSVALPGQSRFVWTNRETGAGGDAAVFEVEAGPEPQKVLFLRTPAAAAEKPVIEVFYECGGNYVSQGKVE